MRDLYRMVHYCSSVDTVKSVYFFFFFFFFVYLMCFLLSVASFQNLCTSTRLTIIRNPCIKQHFLHDISLNRQPGLVPSSNQCCCPFQSKKKNKKNLMLFSVCKFEQCGRFLSAVRIAHCFGLVSFYMFQRLLRYQARVCLLVRCYIGVSHHGDAGLIIPGN